MADMSKDTATLSRPQPADEGKLVSLQSLPYEIRCHIYEHTLLEPWSGAWDCSRIKPHRQLKSPLFGVIDMDTILNNPWGPFDSIDYWFNFAQSGFVFRPRWYRCHDILPEKRYKPTNYERVIKDLTMRAHPDTLEDFIKFYWDTRVLDLQTIMSYRCGNTASYSLCGHALITNSHWNQHVNHLALQFDSLEPDSHIPSVQLWPQLLDDRPLSEPKAKCSGSAIPTDGFITICNYVKTRFTKLTTFYLWLKLSREEIEGILSAPVDQPHPLVELIRKIPVKKGGKLVVRLLMDVYENREERGGRGVKDIYVRDWEGLDGPARYGKTCRGFEERFEVLMRPESLGPIEEGDVQKEGLEKALELVKASEIENALQTHGKVCVKEELTM